MCISHRPAMDLLKEAGPGLLERESARKNHMGVRQGNESESRRGSLPLIIRWPAGGAIAHFKGTAGARYPAKVESLKSPPKKLPGKIIQQLGIYPMQRTSEPNYNGTSQAKPFLPLASPPLFTSALQKPKGAGSKGGKRLSQKEKQSDHFCAGVQSTAAPS